MIKFDKVPSSIRKPGQYMEFNTRLAAQGLPATDKKILLIGQMTSAGAKAAETPFQVFSDAEAAEYFGAGSIAHAMAKAAIKANPYADLYVIAVADAAAAAAAAGTITFTGPATSLGKLTVGIGADITEIAIASGASATEIAAAVKAALDNKTYLPVTATVLAGVLTLTAKNKGTLGNGIGVAAENTAPGVTATVVAMAGGSVDPDITDALTAVEGVKYDLFVSSFSDSTSLGVLKTHLVLVGGPIEAQAGIGVFGYAGLLADLKTLTAALNSEWLHSAYLRGAKNPVWELAAAEGAVMASEADPARPLNGLTLTGIAAPEIPQRLSRTEQEECLSSGISPLEVNASEEVAMVRAITTYTKNAQGIPDPSMLDVTTMTSMIYLREAVKTRVALRFPREKLNDRSAAAVRTEIYDVLKKAEAMEIVEHVDENADALITERDANDANRLNVAIPADIVNGLHVLGERLDLIL